MNHSFWVRILLALVNKNGNSILGQDENFAERRFDRIEGKLSTLTMAIVSGGIAMAASVYLLAGRISLQNGRVSKNEQFTNENRSKLQIVTWVGGTFMLVLIPAVSYGIIKVIERF